MANPVYHVYIDFNCVNFAGVHDFTTDIDDVSDDVKHIRISRGKDKDSNTYPAATMELLLENSSGRYYPTATTGDYVGLVRLWLPVKVEAVYGGTTYPLYYGYINRITAYPIKSKQDIYFYCTDGIDLLSKTIVVQDMDHKTVMNDGEAVSSVLNAAGWKTADINCTFQNTGDTVTKAGHGLSAYDTVMFSGASIPVSISKVTTYYVVNPLENTFQIAEIPGGDIIVFTADGSGSYHEIIRRAIDFDGGDITNFPDTFEFVKGD